MPADADLLCEFYLSSQLSSTKSSSSSLYNRPQQQQQQQRNGGGFNQSAATSFTVDSIDFVKYTKNPMSDGLKRKYECLVNNHHQHANGASGQTATTTTTTTTTSVSQQQQTSIVSAITSTSASLGKSNLMTSPTSNQNGSPLNSNHSVVTKTSPTTNGTSNGVVVAVNGSASTNGKQTVNGAHASCLDLSWSRIRKTGIGLYNLGNNCYLNATLQCLAYTAPFSQWLVTRPHSPSCRFRMLKGFCSLCEVERIVFDIFNLAGGGGYACAKPNNLCFNIKKISNVFGVGTQEDASEFLTTLLENMAKAIKFSQHQQQQQQQQIQMKKAASKHHTILDDIFAFQFRSRITCSSCGRLSDTIEDANIWPLEVKFVQDIRKGMLHFLKEEILDGENAYKCEKCGRKTRATKKYSIRSAPNILVIHLKRFDSSHAGKLSHYVGYPETLSLPESLTGNNVQYRLYGVLVHLGYTSHSGHYYSYVRAPNGHQWFKADDSSVSAVSANDALTQNAYILFYSKISNPATTTTTTNDNSNAVSPKPTSSSTNSAPIHLPRSILLNGSLSSKHPTQQNHTNNIPIGSSNGTSNTLKPESTTTHSSTSNYLNGICVGKRPSSSPAFIPRIIKANEETTMGPSPAKMPRLEYGPQLPPTIQQRQSPPKSTSSVVDSPKHSQSAKTNGHHHHNHHHYHHQNGKEEKEEEVEEEEEVKEKTTSKKSSSKKKLRRKRLKKLIRQVRQGRVKPDEISEKQLKYAKTKKEKKRLKKALKKATAAV